MKRLTNTVSNLFGLLALIGLAVVLVLVFSQRQQGTQTGASVFQSPIQPPATLNLTCSSALRPSDQPAPAILRGVPTPQPGKPAPSTATTSRPERGPRVSSPTLLMASNSQATIGFQIATRGDQSAIPITDAEGWTCLFVSNLATGRSEQIATLRGSLGSLSISDSYLVWTDEVYTPEVNPCPPAAPATETRSPSTPCTSVPPQQRTELHIYDLRARREVKREIGQRRFLALAGDVLAWQEYRGADWGIYGQKLSTGQSFTITTQGGSYPKVFGEWVAYVTRSKDAPESSSSELHLFNWQTGQDRLLGLVPSGVDGGGYTMEGNSLAWVKFSFGSATIQRPVHELHVYDLATGKDRKVDINDDSYLTGLQLSDDLLIYLQKGWQAVDLKRDLKFSVFPSSAGLESLGKIALSGNRLVWLETEKPSGVIRLYLAQLDRGQ